MIFDIKEQNGGYLTTVSGRLDTPAAVKASRRLHRCWKMPIRKSSSTARIWSTSARLVCACFSPSARRLQPRVARSLSSISTTRLRKCS